MNIKLYIILKLYFLLIKTLYFYTLYFLLTIWKICSVCFQDACSVAVIEWLWEIWNFICIKIKAMYLRYVCIIFIRIVIYIYILVLSND